MWVDAHCHLDFEAFDQDRASVALDAYQEGVKKVSVPGVSSEQWGRRDLILEMLESQMPDDWEWVPQYGVHPYWNNSFDLSVETELRTAFEQKQTALLGEVGVDFMLDKRTHAQQLLCFQHQLEWAKDYNRPAVLHVRKAHHEVFRILKLTRWSHGGMVHAFSGSIEVARKYLELGFYLGIGGAATFDQAVRLQATIKALPLRSLVLETDSPDMPPQFLIAQQSEKSKIRNTPLSIPKIGLMLSQLKEIPLGEVAKITTENANRLFKNHLL